jgi:hypothetical protein
VGVVQGAYVSEASTWKRPSRGRGGAAGGCPRIRCRGCAAAGWAARAVSQPTVEGRVPPPVVGREGRAGSIQRCCAARSTFPGPARGLRRLQQPIIATAIRQIFKADAGVEARERLALASEPHAAEYRVGRWSRCYTARQMIYDLRRLCRKRFIQRLPRTHRYELGSEGRRLAVLSHQDLHADRQPLARRARPIHPFRRRRPHAARQNLASIRTRDRPPNRGGSYCGLRR